MQKNKKKSRTTKLAQPAPGAGKSKSARRRARARGLDLETEGFNASAMGFGLGKTKFSFRNQDFGSGPIGTVGVAPHSMNIQTIMPRIRTELGGKYGATDILMGTEFLQSVNSAETGNQPGDILSTILINPISFANTRLKQFGKLYERYRFRKVNFVYEPIANATVSGQLIGFGDYDPDNILVLDDPTNISIAAAHIGQQNVQVWESKRFPFGVVDDFTTLYTSPANAEEARLVYQGVYYLLASSELPATTALGNIYVEYEIEMNIPVLETADLQESVFTAGLFTTNSSTNANQFLGSTDIPLGYSVPPDLSPYFFGSIPTRVESSYTAANGTLSIVGLPPGAYIIIVTLDGTFQGTALYNSAAELLLTIKVGTQVVPFYPAISDGAYANGIATMSQPNTSTGTPGFGGEISAMGIIDTTSLSGTLTIKPSWNFLNAVVGFNTSSSGITLISFGTLPPVSSARLTAKEFLNRGLKTSGRRGPPKVVSESELKSSDSKSETPHPG